MSVIEIDKYDIVYHKSNISINAIAGKTKYPIPAEFVDMCDNEHLAITEVTTEMPELFNTTTHTFYIPLRHQK